MAGFISSGSVSEGQKNKAMKKRDWVIIGCIIVGGIVIACLINWSLTYGSWIKTNLSIDSTLLSGIALKSVEEPHPTIKLSFDFGN